MKRSVYSKYTDYDYICSVFYTPFLTPCVESISLPDGIETFGEGVFQGCGFKSLESVKNLRVIGPDIPAHTFASCQQIDSMQIPEWVDNIGEGAFADIPYLSIWPRRAARSSSMEKKFLAPRL